VKQVMVTTLQITQAVIDELVQSFLFTILIIMTNSVVTRRFVHVTLDEGLSDVTLRHPRDVVQLGNVFCHSVFVNSARHVFFSLCVR
jgi:hypothetical protein